MPGRLHHHLQRALGCEFAQLHRQPVVLELGVEDHVEPVRLGDRLVNLLHGLRFGKGQGDCLVRPRVENRRLDLGLLRLPLEILELLGAVGHGQDFHLLLHVFEHLLGVLVGGIQLNRHLQLVARCEQPSQPTQGETILEMFLGGLLPREGQLHLVVDVVRILGKRLQIVVYGGVPVLVLERLFPFVPGLCRGGATRGRDQEHRSGCGGEDQ